MFDENSLVERVLSGDEDAFSRLVDRLEPRVYQYALRYLGEEQEARQATIETFNQVYRKLHRNMELRLSIWALRLAADVCADIQKRKRGAKSTMSVFRLREIQHGKHGQQQEAVDLDAAIQAQLLRLTRQQREVLLMRDLIGLSDAETGQVLKLDLNGVRLRISRARRNLRELLVRQGALPQPEKRGEGRDCPHFQELCSQYVDECIEEDDKAALLDHIQECSRCAAYLNDLTLIGRALSHMEEEKAPEELRDEVVRSAVRQQRERAGWRALGLRIPIVALACFAALFAVLVCSGVLGGLFVNTTKQEAKVQKDSTQSSSVLSQDLRLPDAVTDMSYSYVIAAAGNAGLPELSASAELIAAEGNVEYYRVDGGLEIMQKLAEGMESVGYELESVSNDQLVITPTASQGLFIVIRQTQEDES